MTDVERQWEEFPLPEELRPWPHISPEKLKDILSRPEGHSGYVLRAGHQVPDDKWLWFLASQLEYQAHRFWFSKNQLARYRKLHDGKDRALEALRHFLDECDREVEAMPFEWREYGERTGDQRKARDCFERLAALLDKRRGDLLYGNAVDAPEHERDSWVKIEGQVAESFITVMAAANPGKKYRFSNKGPVARFLAQVLPLIAGERKDVNAEAVINRVKRRRRKAARS